MGIDDIIISKVIALGEEEPSVRVMILTSTRANPNAPCDVLSDYDVEVATTDPDRFLGRDDWFESLGPVLVVFRDGGVDGGIPWHTRLVLYRDGSRVDFCIRHVDDLKRICDLPSLPDGYDIGYRVLLDKDGITTGLRPPTYRAFIPSVPTEAYFTSRVNDFWWDSTCAAKYLWRDDLLPVKFMLEWDLVGSHLRQMLEWSIEIERGWSWKPGAYGRGMKKALDPDIYKELQETYAGGDIKELWESLFRTADLFRKVATKVADSLGYKYPHDLDRQVTIYNQAIRCLDRQATDREELTRLLREGHESG